MDRQLKLEIELKKYLENTFSEGRTTPHEDYKSFERILFDFISGKLISQIEKRNKVGRFEANINKFIFKNKPFEIRYVPNKYYKNKLSCSILPSNFNHNNDKVTIKKITLQIYIKYKDIELIISNSLMNFMDTISETITISTHFAYNWLYEQVQFMLDELTGSVVNSLYSEIRKSFHQDIAEKIFLYALYDHGGIYLMDRIIRERIHSKISSNNNITAPPLESLIELTTKLLPPNEVASSEAIHNKGPIILNFYKAKYSSSGVQIAEEAAYDCDKIIVHPLVFENGSYLVAGYPVHYRTHIENKLNQLKIPLTYLVKNNKSTLIRKVKNIKILKNSQFYENLGSFTFGFINSMAKSF